MMALKLCHGNENFVADFWRLDDADYSKMKIWIKIERSPVRKLVDDFIISLDKNFLLASTRKRLHI